MSKGTKQQYKQFKINTLEDACLVLKSIIVPVISNLQKFEKYSGEAEYILKSYDSNGSIPVDIYDSIHDKILYRQRELLRLLADHQSSAFSYIEVRKILEKRNFIKRTLPEKSRKTLNELLELRNFTFHNAQSMLVADIEIAKKSISPEFKDIAEIRPLLNPVIIHNVVNYEWSMLEGLVAHSKARRKQFELSLNEMKEDYQEMLMILPDEVCNITCQNSNKNVQYIEQFVANKDAEKAGKKIALLSMGIQRGKYDGTTELFEKLINEKNI